jgi:hypothetical protein
MALLACTVCSKCIVPSLDIQHDLLPLDARLFATYERNANVKTPSALHALRQQMFAACQWNSPTELLNHLTLHASTAIELAARVQWINNVEVSRLAEITTMCPHVRHIQVLHNLNEEEHPFDPCVLQNLPETLRSLYTNIAWHADFNTYTPLLQELHLQGRNNCINDKMALPQTLHTLHIAHSVDVLAEHLPRALTHLYLLVMPGSEPFRMDHLPLDLVSLEIRCEYPRDFRVPRHAWQRLHQLVTLEYHQSIPATYGMQVEGPIACVDLPPVLLCWKNASFNDQDKMVHVPKRLLELSFADHCSHQDWYDFPPCLLKLQLPFLHGQNQNKRVCNNDLPSNLTHFHGGSFECETVDIPRQLQSLTCLVEMWYNVHVPHGLTTLSLRPRMVGSEHCSIRHLPLTLQTLDCAGVDVDILPNCNTSAIHLNFMSLTIRSSNAQEALQRLQRLPVVDRLDLVVHITDWNPNSMSSKSKQKQQRTDIGLLINALPRSVVHLTLDIRYVNGSHVKHDNEYCTLWPPELHSLAFVCDNSQLPSYPMFPQSLYSLKFPSQQRQQEQHEPYQESTFEFGHDATPRPLLPTSLIQLQMRACDIPKALFQQYT